MVFKQCVNNFNEISLPWLWRKYEEKRKSDELKKDEEHYTLTERDYILLPSNIGISNRSMYGTTIYGQTVYGM